MRAVFGTALLADDADASMAPSQLGIGGAYAGKDSSFKVGAPTLEMLPRGGRSVRVDFVVDYGFGTYEEASAQACLKWNALPDQDDLYLTFGEASYVVRGAVLDPPEVVKGELKEVACLIRYSFEGALFESVEGSDVVTSIFTRQTIAPGEAGTTIITLAPGHRESALVINPTANGGTPYTAKIAFPTTDRKDGDKVWVTLNMPASTDPTIQFHDEDGSGTDLLGSGNSPVGVASAQTYVGLFVFETDAWIKHRFHDA